MSISTLEVQKSVYNQLLANEPLKNDLINDLGGLDYQILSKRKNELLKNVEKYKDEIPHDDLISVISRLFEHSIDDGFSLAKKMRFTPKDYLTIVNNPQFYIKHQSFCDRIIKQIKDKKSKINDIESADNFINNIEFFQKELKKSEENKESIYTSLFDFENIQYKNIETKKILTEMDDIYKNYLALKTIQQETPNDTRTQGERLSDNLFYKINNMGKYFSSNVIEAIYQQKIQKEDKKETMFFYQKKEAVKKYLKKQEINKESIHILCEESLIDGEVFDEIVQKTQLKKDKKMSYQYRPLGLTFYIENELAEKQNKKELEYMLENHFGEKFGKEIKLIYDEKQNTYHIEGIKKGKAEKSKNIIIDIGKFDEVYNLTDIGGKLYFQAKIDGKQSVIDESGKAIGGEFDYVANPVERGGKLYFKAREDGKQSIRDESGKVIGGEFDEVWNPFEIGGKLYFKAIIDGKGLIRDENGVAIGGVFDYVGDSFEIGGKLYFKAKIDGKQSIRDEGGKVIGGVFDGVWNPFERGGKLYFQAREDRKRSIRDENGVTIGGEFDEVRDPVEIGGKFYFKAKIDGKQSIRDENGVAIGGEFDYVANPFEIGGKLYFKAKIDGKQSIRDENGAAIGGMFDEVRDPFEIGGKLYFKAREGGKQSIRDENGVTIGGVFYEVRDHPFEIGGKLYFKAREDGKQSIRDENGVAIGGEFDEVRDPFERGGKLYFQAKIDGKQSIRDESGKAIGGMFDEVSIFDGFFVGKTDNTFEKIYFSQAGGQQLTEQQKDKLKVLNLTTTTKGKDINKLRADIDEYRHKQEQKFTEIQKQEKKKKNFFKSHIMGINNVLKNFPGLFLDTISTKNTRLENVISDNLLMNIYPEMFAEEKKNLRNGFTGYMGLGGGNNVQEERPEDYLSEEVSSEMNGGNPETENGTPKEIMKIRGNIDGVVVSGIYGNYDEATTRRHKSYFHVDTEIIGPKTTTTITLPHINPSRPIILPKPINSNIVESRVKGIKKNGEEVFIVPEINSLNEAKVSIGNDIKEIIYSIETPKIQANIPDISNDEYQRFKQSIEKDMDSNELTKPLCNISDDSKLFLQSISTLSPKQKIITIEQYVRDKSFYDYGNKEVMDIKRGKSIEEKNYICEQRIDELQQRKPELKNILDGKKRAGVCADFATILIGELLREAGFVSGVISGFLATGQSVTGANAHGVAYVVMPNARGKNQIIIVDGTPHGSGSASTPSLGEKEKDIEEKKEELKSDLQKKLDIIESIIDSSDDIDFIKNELSQLYNGNLEDMMNAILANDVNIQNYTTIENILNAYRYSPITKEQDKEKIKSFLLGEMKPQLSKQDNNDKLQIKGQAGSMMFDMVNDFMERFTKSDKVNLGSKLDALNLLDTIIDMIGDSLSKVEFKSTKLIIKYLKAENIKGKVK